MLVEVEFQIIIKNFNFELMAHELLLVKKIIILTNINVNFF